MIIVGYQGIGKSTLAVNGNGYIDLESGNMFVNGERQHDWHIPYCQMANHLSQQGYKVFTSSHQQVREWFRDNSDEVKIIVFPSIELKDTWIQKLEIRWQRSKSDKDYRAYVNAKCRYTDNIEELRHADGFDPIEIKLMDYGLREEIERYEAQKGKDKHIAELEAERDAAVANLNIAHSCSTCLYHNAMSCRAGVPCMECTTRCCCIECKNWDKWQWHGIREGEK